MIIIITAEEHKVISNYKNMTSRILKINFPELGESDIDSAIDYSINKRYKEEKCIIDNNYSNKKASMSLLNLSDYILDREPIITAYGTMWKRKGTVPNPLSDLVKSFMDSRGINKKKMFKFPKGSEDFEKYNLLQLLDKIDCNAVYGILGLYCSLFFNLHVAASITAEGRSLVSSAGMFFEMFLANNVKFGSLDEVITYIDNIVSEYDERTFDDDYFLDRNIDIEECFQKIVSTCGFEWIPTMEELDIIYDLLCKLNQSDINRIYYKNNLYEFTSNSKIKALVNKILEDLDEPFMNPNEPPECIKEKLDFLTELYKEYVYYHYMIIDRVDRMNEMVKSVCVISDTDSAIVSLDAWYRYILEDNKYKNLKILNMKVDLMQPRETDEFGRPVKTNIIQDIPPILDYDFYEDETIELERSINLLVSIPQDNLRYSIINIMAYILSQLSNDYMLRFCKLSHSRDKDEDSCLIILKNEFLFKRALLTMAKKNYATIQEVQEGNVVDKDNRLDIKGLAIDKSSMNEKTRKQLKFILYEDILMSPDIDQIQVVKDLAILDNQIYQSLASGSKEYYKPLTIKSMSTYDNPMSIQGIKASVVWNTVKDKYLEAINLEERNSIDIVKVNITRNNVDKIKDEYPEIYSKMVLIIGNKEMSGSPRYEEYYKGQITAIAIPRDVAVPSWVIPFIDYTTIINDNICNFPLESIGIKRLGKSTVNYSNIASF